MLFTPIYLWAIAVGRIPPKGDLWFPVLLDVLILLVALPLVF